MSSNPYPSDIVALVCAQLRSAGSPSRPAVQSALVALQAVVPVNYIRAALQDPGIMPHSYIVVQPAGGAGSGQFIPIADFNVAIRCYGVNAFEAAKIERMVRAVLIPADRTQGGFQQIDGNVLGVIGATGPTPLTDADGKWPYRLSVYTLRLAEVTV